MNFAEYEYFQGYSQSKEAFRCLPKDDILHLYICDHDFSSSNTEDGRAEIGYSFYVCDIRYQKNIRVTQLFDLAVMSSANNPELVNGYALVLTVKLICFSSIGKRYFDVK